MRGLAMRLHSRLLTLLLLVVAGQVTTTHAQAAVSLTDNGTTVTLANGTITAVIQKGNGQVTSMKLGALETVSGNIYYSMDGGASYQQPGPCVYSITTQMPDLVDVSFFQVYTTQPHAFDIDIHYVLRSGDSGLYTYSVLSHPASYAATNVGEYRTVWKHPNDPTNFTFENIYVDDLRHHQGPSYFDIVNASPTSIAEVVYLNTGVRANTYFGKYDYNGEYNKIGTWGHASNVNRAGVWVVLGSYEFLNDGPVKQDLTIAEGYTLVHYGRNHYDGSGTSVAAGEAWSKMYGPWLLYMNSCPAGADACWMDAKAKVQTEQAAWPYSWVTNPNYPPASGRGTVTGAFIVSDPIKTSLTGAGAWVGLAQPAAGGTWQYESKNYQYWVKADAAGNFTIPNVRPGSYTLYAFVNGAVGEYSQANIAVSAGAAMTLGNVTWNVSHPGSSIAWEIGVPDRSAAEFRHGNDYFQAFLYNNFSVEFTNPLNYTVGISNWATDWNYVHTSYIVNGVDNAWPWNINFNLASVPASGNATLTIAWAGTDHAAEQVFVNDPNMLSPPLRDFYPIVGGGNALIREGIHAKYGVDYVTIPVSLLRLGANTITLLERRYLGGNHAMYDYLNLEMPTVGAPDFSIGTSPTSQTVTAGAGTSYTASVTPSGGFTGTVTFSVTGLPSGATHTFNPASVAGSGNSNLSVTTSSTTPAGSYLLTITGTSGSLAHSATLTLVVNAVSTPDFSIAASPASRTVTAGTGTSYAAAITSSGGFAGTVNFSVSGLPSGAGGTFNPTSVAGSGSSTLSVTTGSTTPAGTYSLTITGTSGSLVHSAGVTLVVNTAGGGDFSISASPSSLTISPGDSAAFTVTVAPTGGFAGTVTFTATGVPAGMTSSFSPASVVGSGTATLTLTGDNVANGAYVITITGTSGGVSRTATVTLTVSG